MKLNGEKVYLQPISLKYAKTFTKWTCDPEVIKFTTIKPLTIEEEKKWITEMKHSGKDAIFGVFVKENDRLIGSIGSHNLNNPDKHFGIGIIIGEKDCWGKGYGTDAFKTLTKYLFEKKHANKLILDVRVENKAAIRVYEKCGFKRTRKFKKLWERENKKYDCWYMEKTAHLG